MADDTKGTPTPNSRAPSRRGAAAKAQNSFKEQLASSDSESEDLAGYRPVAGGSVSSPSRAFDEPEPKRGSVKIRYGKIKNRDGRQSYESPQRPALPRKSVSIPVTLPRSRAKASRKRKRGRPPNSSKQHSAFSEPLSSLSPSPEPSDVFPHPDFLAHAPSSAKLLATSVSSSSPQGKSRNKINGNKETMSHVELVWVLVDRQGDVVQKDSGGEREEMWWPGRDVNHSSDGRPSRVQLFGDISSSPDQIVEVEPSFQENVLSFLNPRGMPRFDTSDFMHSRPPREDGESPRKRQKSGILSQWRDAIRELIQVDLEDSDGLLNPNYIGWGFDAIIDEALKKYQNEFDTEGKDEVAEEMVDTSLEEPGRYWSPPPCDSELDIPGELVLARTRTRWMSYYPAKLLEYIPPKKSSQKPKFRALFLDGGESTLPREYFYTYQQSDFGTCKLGEFKSTWTGEEEFEGPGGQREPTPLPQLPPPSDFVSLTIPAQLAYVKPVLTAILNDEYGPAKNKHDAYIRGGSSRVNVTKNAGQRGVMSEREVSEFGWYIIDWALQNERYGKRIFDEETELVDMAGGNKGPSLVDSLILSTAKASSPCALSQMSSLSSLMSESSTQLPRSSPPEPPPSSSFAFEHASTEDNSALSPLSSSNRGSEQSVEAPPASQSCEDQEPSPPHHENIIENPVLSKPQGTQPTQRPRQRGCEAYEGLAAVERVGYCQDILVPEAILQILLWRTGERTSIELLDPTEEQRLHELGETKLQERDWVFDVMRLRSSKERTQKTLVSVPQTTIIGGTRSRPRQVRIPRH